MTFWNIILGTWDYDERLALFNVASDMDDESLFSTHVDHYEGEDGT
jgi:hypothetical protein